MESTQDMCERLQQLVLFLEVLESLRFFVKTFELSKRSTGPGRPCARGRLARSMPRLLLACRVQLSRPLT
jgi:hypothetical protein